MGGVGRGWEEVGDDPARLAVESCLDVSCIINPDGKVQKVDGPSGEVVGLPWDNFKLDGGMAGI